MNLTRPQAFAFELKKTILHPRSPKTPKMASPYTSILRAGNEEASISSISSQGGSLEELLGRWSTPVWLAGPWVIGVFLSLTLPAGESALPGHVQLVSDLLGWTYFAAWSISFYPQIYLNYVRKSVVGLSLDFQLLNFLGEFFGEGPQSIPILPWTLMLAFAFHHAQSSLASIP
jgi:hypothetical protein